MELKTKYQYTYFIYPFIVKENKMKKYLLRIIRDKNCKMRFFEKEKDFDIYNYFLPNIREYLFKTFEFNKQKIKKYNEFSDTMKANILNSYPCNIFEYKLKEDIQGKIIDKDGIFFRINKIEIICFHTGICFISIKTNIENTDLFSDVLNFNYKFKDINSELNSLKNYENIKIQTDKFQNMEELSTFIKKITGKNIDTIKLDIDTDKFIIHSYCCLEQEYWNEESDFKQIENEFYKYTNYLPSRYNSNINHRGIVKISRSSYVKIGTTIYGNSLISSGADSNSYTKLPVSYENEYLYHYIFNLYKKIYLQKILNELTYSKKGKKPRKKIIEFTSELWVRETTDNSFGSILEQNWKKALGLNLLFDNVKKQYDIIYKEANMDKMQALNKGIIVALCISLIVNIANFITLIFIK